MKCAECGAKIYEDLLAEGVCPNCGHELNASEVVNDEAEDETNEEEKEE